MSKNVKIPMELFSQIIDILDYIDVSGYDPVFRYDCECVVDALVKKKQSLELRETYAKIVYAKDDEIQKSFLNKLDAFKEEAQRNITPIDGHEPEPEITAREKGRC